MIRRSHIKRLRWAVAQLVQGPQPATEEGRQAFAKAILELRQAITEIARYRIDLKQKTKEGET